MSNRSPRTSVCTSHSAVTDCPRTSPSGGYAISDHAARMIALRLRLLGHPARVRLVSELRADASSLDLADRLALDPTVARAHLTALYGGGVVCRTDTTGPAMFRLVSWADRWLIEQYASRLHGTPARPASRRDRT